MKIHLEHYPISETSQYRSLNKSKYVNVYFLAIHQLLPEISDLRLVSKEAVSYYSTYCLILDVYSLYMQLYIWASVLIQPQ